MRKRLIKVGWKKIKLKLKKFFLDNFYENFTLILVWLWVGTWYISIWVAKVRWQLFFTGAFSCLLHFYLAWLKGAER